MIRFRFVYRSVVSTLLLAFAASSTVLAGSAEPSYMLASAPLFIDAPTSIPGHTLKPGSYSIRIVDRLKDRFILRVDDTEGKALATFIGLHNPEFDPLVTLHHEGTILWTAAPKGTVAVRGFSFPNGNTLEFVYPKNEAVTLAKLNAYSVPAIDPESEGRKPDPQLAPEDREVVTLWMLTETRVGPKNQTPAIEAKRFVAPVEPQPTVAIANPVQPKATLIAKAEPQPDLLPARESRVKSKPVAVRLPKTGSELPELLLLSLLSLVTAGGLRLARRRA